MGRRARIKPNRLPEKLLHIRSALGYSQSEMLRQLGFENHIDYRRVSEFELGANEPPLPVLLAYAHAAGVHVEDIIDDELDLPIKLPGTVKYEGLKRKVAGSKKRN